jgi:integrase
MNLKRYMLFVLDKEPGRTDAKLRFRVKWIGGIASFSLGYRVDTAKWSADTQRCVNSTTHGPKKIQANVINRAIQQHLDAANRLFDIYERDDVNPKVAQYKDALNKALGKIKKISSSSTDLVSGYFDMFIQLQGAQNNWATATVTKFKSLQSHLNDFDPGLILPRITDIKLAEFLAYQHKIQLRNTTIAKNVTLMNWFLRWAHKNKFYSGDSHETFRPRLKGSDSRSGDLVYLNWSELQHLLNMPIPDDKEHLQRVRDVFCFCCFTSLRYSDVVNLRKSDVRSDYIYIVTVKTQDGIKIELNKYAKSILAKYTDIPFPGDRALPVISNPKMNEHLKVIGKMAGMEEMLRVVYFMGNQRHEAVYPKYELLTTHCGRRTFIVNSLFLGIPAEVVMKWTGHSDYKAMKPYIKIVDELKQNEMSKFDKYVLVHDEKKMD